MDMDENEQDEFTKWENGSNQSPEEHHNRRNGQKKKNPIRNSAQKLSEVGRKSEQTASQMQEKKVFQKDDLYCICAKIYKAL